MTKNNKKNSAKQAPINVGVDQGALRVDHSGQTKKQEQTSFFGNNKEGRDEKLSVVSDDSADLRIDVREVLEKHYKVLTQLHSSLARKFSSSHINHRAKALAGMRLNGVTGPALKAFSIVSNLHRQDYARENIEQNIFSNEKHKKP